MRNNIAPKVQLVSEPLRLWLDDDEENRKAPEGWLHVTWVPLAIHVARFYALIGEWEACDLDHDMGQDADGNDLPTGLDFVWWMVRTGTWPKRKPAVHSFNAYGGNAMREVIDIWWPRRA